MNENIRRVEMVLQEVLNVGLGAFNTAQAVWERVPDRLSTAYGRLVSQGARDRSPLADRLHDGLDQGLDGWRETRKKLNGRRAVPLA